MLLNLGLGQLTGNLARDIEDLDASAVNLYCDTHYQLNPSNAEATFVQSTKTHFFLKTI